MCFDATFFQPLLLPQAVGQEDQAVFQTTAKLDDVTGNDDVIDDVTAAAASHKE